MSRPFLSALLSMSLLVSGCGDPPEDNGPEAPERPQADSALPDKEAPEAVRALVAERSEAACESMEGLHQSAREFLDSPQAASLSTAREAWKRAHLDYLRLAIAYRQASLAMPQVRDDRDPIDAYPMLPGYLDRVPGYPRSGIAYSEVPLTPDFLQDEHQSTDFYYLTLGFHPVETLLWGAAGREPAVQAELFEPRTSPDGDRVDARGRRIELLRLITNALRDQMRELCTGQDHSRVLSALAHQAYSVPAVVSQLSEVLEEIAGEPLARWQEYPGGEDRNGMPVWHAPLVRTDFREMQMQMSDLANAWLPTLLAEQSLGQERVEQVRRQMDALAVSLGQHHEAAGNQSRERIIQTRSQLNELLVSLSTLGLAEGPATLDGFRDDADSNQSDASEKTGE